MPRYQPITDIMPLASMVTGAVVTSALSDQIRDNLCALYEGVWFRATRSTTLTIPTATATLVPLDTLDMSVPASEASLVALANGQVTTYKAGIWLVGGAVNVSASTSSFVVAVDATDSLGTFLCEDVSDTGNTKTDAAVSSMIEVVTTPNTFGLWCFEGAGNTLAANSRGPALWGVWLGKSP